MGVDDNQDLLDSVLSDITPDNEERGKLRETRKKLVRKAREEIRNLDLDADIEVVGSTARDTWLSGQRDIDIFIMMPTSLEKSDLKEKGLEIGRAVLPSGDVEYAEHPYVHDTVDGFDVDIVPCYKVNSPTEIKSSVDRTPFHNEYIQDKIKGLENDVRLLKAFMDAAGVYGSELRRMGFSGYLSELLVLKHGGFEAVVKAAADWEPQVKYSIRDESQIDTDSFRETLVFIDPTDPDRNAAAAVSRDSFAKLIDWSREYLENPRRELFYPTQPSTIDAETLREKLLDRESRLIAVVFEKPGQVDDVLYPQLRKTQDGITSRLEDEEFKVIRSMVAADENALILLELDTWIRSRVDKHVGPPVHLHEHAEKFKEKYMDNDEVDGPYIEDGCYVVERRREFVSANEYIDGLDLNRIGTGKHVGEKMREGMDVLVDDEVEDLLDEFGVEIGGYFDV